MKKRVGKKSLNVTEDVKVAVPDKSLWKMSEA